MRCIIGDDSLIMRARLSGYLKLEGHEVLAECDNAKETLETCRRLKPDLALFDIVMPPGDGVVSAMALKEEFPEILVIIVSSNSQNALIGAASARGIYCIKKPITKEKFLKHLYRLNGELNGDSRPGSTDGS